ncbi:hypothetical protein DDE20_00495 [Pararhodobacter oceanensis]|uniref:3-deoxy-D-manno-octulosonic acid transferase n=2 Tax=Pararhodobacter oceanensis TaxID=2172121 RepID=A0A2T8HXD4_9RHOB|nr:hypothetical protein DDE20_00495 [Pararhodobacter oceanensis]
MRALASVVLAAVLAARGGAEDSAPLALARQMWLTVPVIDLDGQMVQRLDGMAGGSAAPQAEIGALPVSWRLRLVAALWQVLLHLALPVMLLLLWQRGRREPAYRQRLGERFGGGAVGAKGGVWIFAASLGETRAVSPLVRRFLEQGVPVLLTHSTPAGLQEGLRLFPEVSVVHRYVPLDLSWALARMLRRAQPKLGLVVESELWPGQLLVARRLGIPMAQVNGNLLERTIARDSKRLGGVRLELLRLFSLVLTKSETYRDRYLRAGVEDARIRLVGELKFDQWVDPAQPALGQRLRTAWGAAPVLLIASSIEAEEPLLLPVLAALLAHPSAPRIIWAPRSPQRFDAVSEQLDKAGIAHARRSDLTLEDAPTPHLLLADSLGEMNIWYAMADLVFVGASLVAQGGHNIIEPLAQGKPVVMGESIFGITYPALDAIEAGALEIFPSAQAMATRLQALLGDPAALAGFTACAAGFNATHLGASARSYTALQALTAPRGTAR